MGWKRELKPLILKGDNLMTREEAKLVLYELINSGILEEELENKLIEIAECICISNFKE